MVNDRKKPDTVSPKVFATESLMDLGKTTITSGPRKHVHSSWFIRNFSGLIV